MHSVPVQQTPAPGTGRKLTAAVIGGALLFGSLLVVGTLPRLHKNHQLTAASLEVRSEAPPVNFVTPKMVAADALVLPGSMQAIEQTTINARTSGYLRRRYVDIGSRVKAGQLLAEIESPEVDQQVQQAVADTAKSQAGTGQAQADVARQQAGVSQSRAEFLRAQASLKQAQAGLTHAVAHVSQSNAAEAAAKARLAQAKQDLEGRKAALAQAKTQEDFTQKTLVRYQNLYKQGFVALQEVDTSQAAYDTAKAGVVSAQAAISSGQANVDAAVEAVNSAHADVESAIADVEASKQNIGAFQAAISSTQATIDAAKANVQASMANVQAAKAGVQSSQANVQRFTVMRGFEKIVAPFDGIITARNVDTGALINAGSSGSDTSAGGSTSRSGLFGIARTDTLRIQVSVPQTYMDTIRTGQKAEVLVREFPGQTFEGLVFQNTGALDPSSRTLLTEVHLPNKNNKLLPGMYADVRFPAPNAHSSALRIPANTLVVDANGTRVVVLTPDNKAHFQTVQIGRDFGKEVEITQGLTGKEHLVTDAGDDLKEGEKVQASPAPVEKDK